VHVSPWAWAIFAALVLAMLAADLGIFSAARRAEGEVTLRSAATWSALWIGLGLSFSLVVGALYGSAHAVTYLTAYILEKSLSVDNIFIFVLIFSELGIPASAQRRVLYWGVLGALVMRALLIAAGVYLLGRFHWVIYPFAALIILAAARMLFGQKQERQVVAAACAACGSWVARFIPITPVIRGGAFWIRQSGRVAATPLFVAVIVIETTDVIFALDSIPAVLAVTRVPFLVYTSNIFALLGLRSLYFLLAGAIQKFRYLRAGLAAILVFVGAKMLATEVIEIPIWVSLAVIAAALLAAITASLMRPATAVQEHRS
jgi:tellurite resistance protein TerC